MFIVLNAPCCCCFWLSMNLGTRLTETLLLKEIRTDVTESDPSTWRPCGLLTVYSCVVWIDVFLEISIFKNTCVHVWTVIFS